MAKKKYPGHWVICFQKSPRDSQEKMDKTEEIAWTHLACLTGSTGLEMTNWAIFSHLTAASPHTVEPV